MTSLDAEPVVDCYVKETAPRAAYRVLEQLLEYEEDGLVSDVSLGVWPPTVTVSDREGHPSILEDLRCFKAWAKRNGVSLEPVFERRERSTLFGQRAEPVVDPPTVCLVVRLADEIVVIAPHETERSTYSVSDALAEIETQRLPGHPGGEESPLSSAVTSRNAY